MFNKVCVCACVRALHVQEHDFLFSSGRVPGLGPHWDPAVGLTEGLEVLSRERSSWWETLHAVKFDFPLALNTDPSG